MVGIRKKMSWSHWSMVNYQHFDCVKKKREREGTNRGYSALQMCICNGCAMNGAFVECHNIIPQTKFVPAVWTLTWKNSTWHKSLLHSSVLQVCISYALDLMWQSFEAFFFFAVRGCTCRLSRNHRQLTSDGGQLGLLFVCVGIIWKFYQHLPNTFNRWHRLPIVLVLTDHSIKL